MMDMEWLQPLGLVGYRRIFLNLHSVVPLHDYNNSIQLGESPIGIGRSLQVV